MALASIALMATWAYISFQTRGLIDKHCANQDATGRKKESKFTRRKHLVLIEWDTFWKNYFFGVGVGKGVEVRKAETVLCPIMRLLECLQSTVPWRFLRCLYQL